MSKGSAQRPRSVADDEWEARWDAIFGKDKPAKEDEKETDKEEPVKKEE